MNGFARDLAVGTAAVVLFGVYAYALINFFGMPDAKATLFAAGALAVATILLPDLFSRFTRGKNAG